MKIGIITFHASFNYGSMLQAYAMQTYLKRLGYQVEIINFRSDIQKAIYYKLFDFRSRYSILPSFKRLLLYPSSIKKINKKWFLFDQFLNQKFNLSKEFNTIDELKSSKFDYDYVIVGSDQIWNTEAPDSGEAYYANFLDNNVKKIAYAPSFGQNPEYNNKEFIKNNLHNFSSLSVREERSRDFLVKNGIEKDVEVVCDPTLLLSSNDYDKLIDKKPIINCKYMFFYTPVGLPIEYFKIANNIAERYGLKVITERAYYPKDIKPYKNFENFPEVGPCEFLNLIKNATCVCGGSFHLQVFSVLFRKNFFCINGDKDSRTNYFLKKLNLLDRIVSLSNPNCFPELVINNYEDVSKRLYQYKQKSIDFINNSII